MPRPFEGQMDGATAAMLSQRNRQDDYQDKIVRKVFTQFGVAKSHLNMLAKRVNSGTPNRNLTMDWFNLRANFPVYLGARRFHAQRQIMELLRVMRSKQALDKTVEVAALADLEDTYPDGLGVAFVCKYPDWQEDIVFHRLEVANLSEGFQVVRGVGEGPPYRIEFLSDFLRRFTEEWAPSRSEDLISV